MPAAWTREDLEALPPDTVALAVKIAKPEDADLKFLAGLKQLETLQIDEPGHISDEGMRALASLPKLKKLSMSLGAVTPGGVALLRTCPTLRSLDLGDRADQLTDEHLAAIGRLMTLEDLYVSGCGVATDAGVGALAGLTRLKSLGLSWSDRITGRTLDALSPAIEKLSFTGVSISKEGAAAMARMPALRKIKFYNGGVEDDHLRALAGCRKLQDLSIRRDNRTEKAPTDAGVAALKSVVGLHRFSITGTSVSGAAVQKLADALPAIFFVR